MEESTWYINQRSELEESLWKLKQRSRELQDYRRRIQKIWQDDAATQLNQRYFSPHEKDSQEFLAALSRQLFMLNTTDEKLQSAKQWIQEANQLSAQIEVLIDAAKQDIARFYSEYGVFQEQNAAAKSELSLIDQLIAQANSCCD
ncbi:hypothetical protein [Picosynechococcus sp. NKBG042902]|uniref:hypothetical protein n=1 Tax=Picosynechococcus sp. NKBG042902 TaxID=490193 RepID=UPI0005F000D0|nr:hypothetical protein [Picosynechococcus sp. NKBG042902]